ncbi:hypothetical protein D3C76_1190540 [compost metagenome]
MLAEARLELRRQALSLGLNLGLAAGQQAQAGQALGQAIGVAVQRQHRFECSEGDLVHAQGTLEWIFLDPGDQVLAADDDPGLRPPQQLVATEGDDIGTIGQSLAYRGFGGQAPAGKVEQAAAAQVFKQWQLMLVGDTCQHGSRHLGGEALDAVIAAMHPHQQASARADGRLVVVGVSTVGSANLVQLHAGTGHDVGNTESTTDLDQLAARDDAFLARAQAVER